MKTHSPLFLLAALGLLAGAGAATAAADTSNWQCKTCPYPKTATTGHVEAGLTTVSEDSAKFGDMTGLNEKGAKLKLGGAMSVRTPGGYYADLIASDLGLDSRSLWLQSGHAGTYDLRLGYAELPRYLSSGAMTPFQGVGSSVLTLPAGYPAASTAGMPLASTLQPVELGYKKKRLDLSARLLSIHNWTLRAGYSRDVRSGTRPGSASFFSSAAQLVLPVDQVTDQVEVSAAYASRSFQAQLGYQVSRFTNDVASLTWTSPYWPVVAGATTGQLALAPSNQLHQVVGSAAYQITPTMRASADFAVGRLTQDAAFLAPTLNASLAPGVPALARASLDGRVDTFNSNVRLSAAPMADLRVNAAYSRNVRNNKTAINSYPLIATDIFLDTATRQNTPFDLTQDKLKLNADYRGFEGIKLSTGADFDWRSRPYHEVVRTREAGVWGKAGVQAGEKLGLSFKLAKASRDHSTYGTATWFGAAENPLLRKYNLAQRDRDTAGVRADVAATETLSLGLAVDYNNDAYAKSIVGLKNARSVNIGADLSAALTEKTQLTAFWQSERSRSVQAGSQFGAGADWRALGDDRFNVLGLGITHSLLADKLKLGADLSLARAKSDLSVDTSYAQPQFPQANTSQDSFKVYANYKLGESLWLNGSLWHERYSATDWRLDGVMPGTLHNLLAFGQQSPEYRVTVLSVSVRYQF